MSKPNEIRVGQRWYSPTAKRDMVVVSVADDHVVLRARDGLGSYEYAIPIATLYRLYTRAEAPKSE